MDLDCMQVVIGQCTVPFGYRFEVKTDLLSNGERPYLQVRFQATDATVASDQLEDWSGRKWFLSPHMTESELVRTAFKAYTTALEHEAREHFLFCGRAVFGPHIDVQELWSIARNHDRREEAQ